MPEERFAPLVAWVLRSPVTVAELRSASALCQTFPKWAAWVGNTYGICRDGAVALANALGISATGTTKRKQWSEDALFTLMGVWKDAGAPTGADFRVFCLFHAVPKVVLAKFLSAHHQITTMKRHSRITPGDAAGIREDLLHMPPSEVAKLHRVSVSTVYKARKGA